MKNFCFQQYIPKEQKNSTFENLLNIFLELANITSGDMNKVLSWLTQLDKTYDLTDKNYGMGDFIKDLEEKGYIKKGEDTSVIELSSKSEQTIRKKALEEIFGKLRKSDMGLHPSANAGKGESLDVEKRKFEFGDGLEQIDFPQSIQNALKNQVWHQKIKITERELEVLEKEQQNNVSTVLLIDISHSMVLYGEDRITPAKKVAMALVELIKQKYKKDTLEIVVFGNDAWQIEIKDLPYLKVGPYHTNTVAGIELGMALLKKKKNKNKQIFMITDGKPTCLKIGMRYYKNSFGLDMKIINKTLDLAIQCKKMQIPITTFMIASDPYLKQFVRDFTSINQGNAYYSSLDDLGSLVFENFRKRKIKKIQ